MRVTLPGNNGGRFTMTGSLAFLQATITNGVDVDHDGTIADTDTVKEETNQAKISLNIKDPDTENPDNRLSIKDLLGQDGQIGDAPARPARMPPAPNRQTPRKNTAAGNKAVGPSDKDVAKNDKAEKSARKTGERSEPV